MLNILKELNRSKELACYYSGESTETFDVGIVLALNSEYMAFQSLNKNGEDDGVYAYKTDLIFRVETKGQYLEKMKKLSGEIGVCEIAEEIDEDNIINSLLQAALKRKAIVSVTLIAGEDVDFVGFVESIEDGECKFRIVDEYGFEDGFGYGKLSDIVRMSYMSADDKRYMQLWKANYEHNG